MLATDPADAIDQLTGILNAANALSVWVDTLVNATIPQLNPPPAWYEAIDAALKASQQHAHAWRAKTAPEIITDMTGAFISYADDFASAAPYAAQLVTTINQQGHIPKPGQVQELTEIFSSLQQAAAANQATVRKLLQAMQSFRSETEADYASLQKSLKAALPKEAAARAAVQQVQTQIQSIEITLAADTATASASTVDTTSAMTSLVIGLALSPEDPFSFGVALIFLGTDAVLQHETEERVISDLKQIQKLSGELSDDELHLGLIQGVVSNLENLSDGIVAALDSFDDFDDTWTLANLALTYLLVVLAQPEIDVSRIPDLNDLGAATAAWNKMSAFASNVVLSQLTPAQPLTIFPPPAA